MRDPSRKLVPPAAQVPRQRRITATRTMVMDLARIAVPRANLLLDPRRRRKRREVEVIRTNPTIHDRGVRLHLDGEGQALISSGGGGRKNEDKMALPPFPSITTLMQWKIDVGKCLVAFGGRTDQKELKWVAEKWAPGQTFETLADSGRERFHYMDLKLSAVLTLMVRPTPSARMLYGDLTVREHEHDAAQKSTTLKGYMSCS